MCKEKKKVHNDSKKDFYKDDLKILPIFVRLLKILSIRHQVQCKYDESLKDISKFTFPKIDANFYKNLKLFIFENLLYLCMWLYMLQLNLQYFCNC